MSDEPDTLITGDLSKLPADVIAMLDPTVPLPPGTELFEKRYDIADMMQRVLISCVLALIAVIMIPLGIAEIVMRPKGGVTVNTQTDYWPLLIGLVFAFGTFVMLASISKCWQLRSRQAKGECTRRGTFLTPGALIQASESDTTIIPPSHFLGLSGRSVKYRYRDQDKSYNLPAALMNATPEQLHGAIDRWAVTYGKVATSQTAPPPLPH